MRNKLGYTLKQGLKQFFRNKTMTFAAAFAITAMLLILGIFFVVILNLNAAIMGVKDDYNSIELYLLDEITEKQAEEIQTEIKTWDNVRSVTYRDKDEAMKVLKENWGENAYLLDTLGENPLPNSIIINMDELENASVIAKKAGKIKGVEDVTFYKDTVERLISITNVIQIGALVLMGFLVIVSIVVVSNTIKLTVIARSEEIFIMRYIGATNGFIRGPFVIEGISIGVISSVIATALMLGLYYYITEVYGTGTIALLSKGMVPFAAIATYIPIIFASLGVAIGILGSMLSMRRFLKK